MDLLLQQILSGLATGSIYSFLALGVVIIFRATGIVNLAQGEMAVFSTFVAWSLVQIGVDVRVAIVLTFVLSFFVGMLIERVVIRPIEGGDHLAIVVVTLGLFLMFNQMSGWLWGFLLKTFPSPFPKELVSLGTINITYQAIGLIGLLALVATGTYLLFNRTKIGLAMRVATRNPESSRLVGISVSRMFMLGWGLAAAIGSLAGAMAAPLLFLEPHMMFGVALYAFAAAALGGFDSLLGAIVGGVIVGVVENLAGTYVEFIGSDLKMLVPFTLIFIVLLVRPNGLFGRTELIRA